MPAPVDSKGAMVDVMPPCCNSKYGCPFVAHSAPTSPEWQSWCCQRCFLWKRSYKKHGHGPKCEKIRIDTPEVPPDLLDLEKQLRNLSKRNLDLLLKRLKGDAAEGICLSSAKGVSDDDSGTSLPPWKRQKTMDAMLALPPPPRPPPPPPPDPPPHQVDSDKDDKDGKDGANVLAHCDDAESTLDGAGCKLLEKMKKRKKIKKGRKNKPRRKKKKSKTS